MKQKIKYLLELLTTKKSKKIILIFVTLVAVFYSSLYIYSSLYEQEKMEIDRYNFNQLNQIKPILKTLDKGSLGFGDIGDFNKTYHANIKPIKNCYYMNSENGDHPYIFGFQLESLFYRFLYFGENYAYPTYDIPKHSQCGGLKGTSNGCKIIGNEIFLNTILYPCTSLDLN